MAAIPSFTYRGESRQAALAVAGQWFWDEYSVRAAVRPLTEGAVGICAYVQDPTDTTGPAAQLAAATGLEPAPVTSALVFRWASKAAETGDDALQLVEIAGPTEWPLAEVPRPFEPNQWYELRLDVGHGQVRAFLDGEPVLQAEQSGLAQGKAGLYVAGQYANFAPMEWRWLSGTWEDHDDAILCTPDPTSGEACAVARVGGWSGLKLALDLGERPTPLEAVSLLFGYQSPEQYLELRWARQSAATQFGPSPRLELLSHRGGEEAPEVLASARLLELPAPDPLLSVEQRGDVVRGLVNGRLFVWARRCVVPEGLVGVRVQAHEPVRVVALAPEMNRGLAAAAFFDDLRVRPLSAGDPDWEAQPVAEVTEQFLHEQTMGNWALPASAWYQPDAETSPGYWEHKLPLYGGVSLELALPPAPPWDWSLALLCREYDQSTAEALGLALTSGPDGLVVEPFGSWAHRPEARVVRRMGGAVSLVYRDGQFAVRSEGETVAALAAPAPTKRPMVGLWSRGVDLDLNRVAVRSPHLLDYTFREAPTEWRVQYGTWGLLRRWDCDPRWGWFGGVGHFSPLIWTKRAFAGDQSLEFWAALKMREGGYPDPSDLNCTLCGDGLDLKQGYAAIFAGDHNTVSKLQRNDEVVASNRQVLMHPDRVILEAFHRHWFNVRVVKTGGRVQHFVDDQQVCDYQDPDPLEAGPMGIWSWNNNGLLISRVRISYERLAEEAP